MGFALGEGAELAPVVADVGVVDVPVDDITNHAAADRLAQLVRDLDHPLIIHVTGGEQADDVLFIEPLAGGGASDDPFQSRIDRVQQHGPGLRLERQAGRPVVIARPTFRIGQLHHPGRHLGMQPSSGLGAPGRIDWQPRHQDFVHFRGAQGQGFKLRPWRFRIDVIRRHRRHAAPVVDAGANELLIDPRRQIGRCLDMHIRRQDQPGRGNGPQQVEQVGLIGIRQLGIRLGPEVLHDNFLDVPILEV